MGVSLKNGDQFVKVEVTI